MSTSQPTSTNPSPPSSSREQPQENTLLAFANAIQVAIIALVFNWLFLSDLEIWFSVRLLILLVLLLAALTSRCWVILVAAIGTSLLDGTPDRSLTITLKSLVYPFAILFVSAYFYLFPALRERINYAIVGVLRDSTSNQQANPDSSKSNGFGFALQLAITAVSILVLVVLAICLVESLPTERNQKIALYRNLLISDSLRMSVSALVVGLLGAYLVLRELNFRRVAPVQARLLVRSNLMRDYGKELLSIHRRIRKQEKRSLKKPKKASKPR
ncbi:MAG: hypothetical protein AAGG44_12865 [Planctomycetota bacterium]